MKLRTYIGSIGVIIAFLLTHSVPVHAAEPSSRTFSSPVVFESDDYFALRARIAELRVQLQNLLDAKARKEGKVVIRSIVSKKPSIGEFISIRAEGLDTKKPVDVFFNDQIAVERIFPTTNEYIAFHVPAETLSWAQCLAWDNSGGIQCRLGQVATKLKPGQSISVTVRNSGGFSESYSMRIAE